VSTRTRSSCSALLSSRMRWLPKSATSRWPSVSDNKCSGQQTSVNVANTWPTSSTSLTYTQSTTYLSTKIYTPLSYSSKHRINGYAHCTLHTYSKKQTNQITAIDNITYSSYHSAAYDACFFQCVSRSIMPLTSTNFIIFNTLRTRRRSWECTSLPSEFLQNSNF